MSTLNLGILAHVDAGKTSLTERLLFAAGVLDEIGSVDDGSTQTDSMELERRRGITIRSAVVSFMIEDVTVNLIDTPGHPDFIAEVERVLGVLDGAVLVISAVEGVQAQTRILLRTLRRLRIPTIIFVNKIDRTGAQYERSLQAIAEKLVPAIVAMGSAPSIGHRDAVYNPFGVDDQRFISRLVDLLADHDDDLLAAYVRDETAVSHLRLRAELAAQTRRALVHPVFFGSAITGAGIECLMAGIRELLPAAAGDPEGPVSGSVFKVERGSAGEKIAYVRMFTGTLRVRDRLRTHRNGGRGIDGESDEAAKVTAISVFEQGSALRQGSISAGQIGQLWGLAGIRIGDAVGVARSVPSEHGFSPPTMETVVLPRRPADRGALHVALVQLAEQDPLINLRLDERRQEISVSLYGEVQKEVIQATLADDFGVEITFRETTTICVERLNGTGTALEVIAVDPNPFLATVGLRIEPAPVNSGVDFRLGIELGSLPLAFIKAIQRSVRETLRQGIHGWQVVDCTVTLARSGYWARQSHAHGTFDRSMSSTAADFRLLTPLVLMTALRQAGTTVHEPLSQFELEIPADTFGSVVAVLTRLRAVPRAPAVRGQTCLLSGEIPAAQVHGLRQRLPGLTRGEGVLECSFERYQPVQGPIPTRPRSDHNPLNREEYLLHVVRRV